MFLHDDSIVFPKLKQCNLPTGRVYMVEDGTHKGSVFPSITTVLKSIPKPGLEAWKKRLGPVEANRQAAVARGKGQSIHKLFEQYLDNVPELPKPMPHVAELWQRLRPWLDQHITKVYAQEQDVFSFKLTVAGRLDLLADVDEELTIVDLKNSAKLKNRDSDAVTSYFVQSTFYALAVFELTGRPVKNIVLPVISPEELQIFTGKPRDYFEPLMKSIDHYYSTK